MKIDVGYGTINRYGDTASGGTGDNHATVNFGLSINISNDLPAEDNEVIRDKLYVWFEEKILNNPKLIQSIEESISGK